VDPTERITTVVHHFRYLVESIELDPGEDSVTIAMRHESSGKTVTVIVPVEGLLEDRWARMEDVHVQALAETLAAALHEWATHGHEERPLGSH
jgi:hypothetical protein